MYCRVAPFQGTFDDYGLVYFIPELQRPFIEVWKLVEIPLRSSIEMAIVLEVFSVCPEDIPEDKIKSLIEKLPDWAALEPYQCRIIDMVSSDYITPIHNAASIFFPRNLREKITKNTFEKITPKDYNYEYINISKLTGPQQSCYREIQNSPSNKILFYGVTGSGKTEIYRELISNNLSKGKQTLLLIPEIILGSQIGERMREIFGQDVLVLSSNIGEAKKTQYWVDIRSGNAKIIVGTRSSLFYPYTNLGMIIMDEEHDQSYISDSAPRYSGREIVSEISKLLDIPVVFASGTPSIESMYRAMKGEYQLVNLLEKYGG